jgi:hypothetical protein
MLSSWMGRLGSRVRSPSCFPPSSLADTSTFTAPSPFDKLPDETISHILSFVMVTLERTSRNLPLFLISKRLASIAAPLCTQTYVGVGRRILRGPASAIRQIVFTPARQRGACPFDTAQYLILFPHITFLTLTGSVAGQLPQVVPKRFTNILRLLPHLSDLKLALALPFILEDKTFNIGDLHSLKRLELSDSSRCTAQLMTASETKLEELNLRGDLFTEGASQPAFPWSTLVRLTLFHAESELEELNAFATSLETVRFSLSFFPFKHNPNVSALIKALVGPSTPSLQALCLKSVLFGDTYQLYGLERLVNAFSRTSIRSLELTTAALFRVPLELPTFTSVTSLQLHFETAPNFDAPDLSSPVRPQPPSSAALI